MKNLETKKYIESGLGNNIYTLSGFLATAECAVKWKSIMMIILWLMGTFSNCLEHFENDYAKIILPKGSTFSKYMVCKLRGFKWNAVMRKKRFQMDDSSCL